MKQAQWKLIVLTLIVASLALTGCSYERKTPSQAQSTTQAGSAGVPTAALIAATTTPALAVPTKQPTTLAIQATATPAVSAPAGATGGNAGNTSAPSTAIETTAPTSSAAPAPVTSAPAPKIGNQPAQEQVHVVQPGQNLFRIALQYGYDVETVARYNGIRNPEMIFVGQEIRIPASGSVVAPPSYGYDAPPSGYSGNVYIVDPGDTLLSIAARYGVSVEALCSANHLTDADTIYVGQRLNIP